METEKVLAKSSWDEADIKFLLQNVGSLPHSALVKLGLAPATKPIEAVKEPVIEPPTGEAKVAKQIIAEQQEVPQKKVTKRVKK